MQASIIYGDRKIHYQLVENGSLTSKIRIHVHPNGNVEVEAPPSTKPSEITRAIYKRAAWISTRLSEVSAVREHVLPREYVSGETHFYLGRRYQLKVAQTLGRRASVKLKRHQILVELPEPDKASVKKHLAAWYKERASHYFEKRLEEIIQSLPWVEDVPPVKLISMRKQWGSCSPQGAVLLNPWLVRAPRECIDYVILHELCHLKEHNHSKRFYELLDRYCVSWRHTKAKLDGMAELLLAA